MTGQTWERVAKRLIRLHLVLVGAAFAGGTLLLLLIGFAQSSPPLTPHPDDVFGIHLEARQIALVTGAFLPAGLFAVSSMVLAAGSPPGAHALLGYAGLAAWIVGLFLAAGLPDTMPAFIAFAVGLVLYLVHFLDLVRRRRSTGTGLLAEVGAIVPLAFLCERIVMSLATDPRSLLGIVALGTPAGVIIACSALPSFSSD